MDSVFFSPKWTTAAGRLANVTENDVVSIQLAAIDDVSFTGVDNTDTFIFANAANIATISVNGTDTTFLVNNTNVTVDSVLQATDAVYMTSNTPLTYTLLHDSLPNGLFVDATTGLISGHVLNLTTSDLVSDFTIRVDNGVKSRDRRFSIQVSPVPTTISPPTWGNYTQYIYNDGTTSFQYIDLGKTTRGVVYLKEIDVFQSGGLSAQLDLEPFLLIDEPFNTLPTGLYTSGKNITGYVDTTNTRGDYFFKFKILDYQGNDVGGDNVRIFKLTVSPPDDILAPLRLITWQTESNLGSLNENEPSPFSVLATVSTGDTIKYKLIYGDVLPFGLELDGDTGEIKGLAAHISATKTTTFTIRAYLNDDSFLDRTFTITIVARYNDASLLSVHVPLLASQAKSMVDYVASLTPDEYVFRPTDSNFGIPNELKMYLIGGLVTADNFKDVIKDSNYKAPIKLTLGEYKYKKIYHNGVYVYDVLYREVIDVNKDAGGYTVTGNIPTENPVIDVFNGQRIYPMSLNNMRYEFLRDFGFPTDATAFKYLQGISGIENMPQWMRNSGEMIYGFVLGYFQPNKGNLILNNITYPSEDPFKTDSRSYGYTFDAYNLIVDVQEISEETTFYYDDEYPDIYPMTFDDQDGASQTIFDQTEYYNGLIIFINNRQ